MFVMLRINDSLFLLLIENDKSWESRFLLIRVDWLQHNRSNVNSIELARIANCTGGLKHANSNELKCIRVCIL